MFPEQSLLPSGSSWVIGSRVFLCLLQGLSTGGVFTWYFFWKDSGGSNGGSTQILAAVFKSSFLSTSGERLHTSSISFLGSIQTCPSASSALGSLSSLECSLLNEVSGTT